MRKRIGAKDLGFTPLLILVVTGLVVLAVDRTLLSSPRDFGPGCAFTVLAAQGANMAFDREVERFVPLQAGMRLKASELRTGPRGAVTLEGGGVVLSLSDGARGGVFESEGAFNLKLGSGEARVTASPGVVADVRSPHGLVKVRGGAVRVRVGSGDLEVCAEKGQARFVTGGGTEVLEEGRVRRIGIGSPTLPALPRSLADTAATGGSLSVPNRRGTGRSLLQVAELDVQVVIEGRIALTRIDQTFHNDMDQRCEGRYSFMLPPGALLSRYAMFTSETRMVEGEIVERERAREIYTEIVRRMQDPALVEWQQGNLFTARIFPIEPRSYKRVLLSYTQVLPRRFGQGSYAFPLVSGLTRERPVGRLALSVEFAGRLRPTRAVVAAMPGLDAGGDVDPAGAPWRIEARDVKPGADFHLSLAYPPLDQPELSAHRLAGDEKGFFLLALPAGDGSNPERADPCDLAIYVDSSLSRAGLSHKLQLGAVEYLLSQLSPSDRFLVRAFDTRVHPIHADRFRDAVPFEKGAALETLARVVPLGGSDLRRAVADLAEVLAAGDGTRRRTAVLLTDGMATLGPRDVSTILAPLAGAAPEKGAPVHVLALGNPVNRGLLDALSRRTGGLLFEATNAADYDRHLLDLAVAVEGGSCGAAPEFRIAPGRFELAGDPFAETLAPGTERLVLGRFVPGETLTVAGRGRQTSCTFPFLEPGNSFVPRLWAVRRMMTLLETPQDQAVTREIVSLSETYTVICPYTSFLVLETERDYATWGIQRAGRRGYWKPWTVQPRPLAPKAPAVAPPARTASPPPAADEDRIPSLADIEYLDLLYDRDEADGSRIVSTATATLCLEIYYRYGRVLNDRRPMAREAPAPEVPEVPLPPLREPAPRQRTEEFKNEKLERDVFEQLKELNVDEPPIEDPVLKDAEISDHNETDNNEDWESSKGVEDSLSDRPFDGRSWNSAIGIGGGAGGTFGGRFGGRRNLRAYGGGRHTESAVLMGCVFLKRVLDDQNLHKRDTLEIALPLLAYLGAGHTHKHGKFKSTVKSLLRFLKDHQREDGRFWGGPPGSETLTHIVATAAAAEAYGLTNKSPLLEGMAQAAVNALAALQRDTGGFGRGPDARSDAQGTALAVLAFKSAKISGLNVPASAFERAVQFLDTLKGSNAGEIGFQDRPDGPGAVHLPSVAGAAIARIFVLGPRATQDAEVLGAAEIMKRHLPDWDAQDDAADLSYWYLGTLAMFQLGGPYWKAWNGALKDTLVPRQRREGTLNGTWDPRPSYLAPGSVRERSVSRAEVEDALNALAPPEHVGAVRKAALLLSAVPDPEILAELASLHPLASLAGQMIRMRIGLLRLLAQDAAGAASLITETYEAAGRPESFCDLAVKALVGAERHADAVAFLSREAGDGRLDPRRSVTLAGLMLSDTGGVADPVAASRALADRTPEKPLDLWRALTFGLTERGRHAESFATALLLFRESGYDPGALEPLLNRLGSGRRLVLVRDLYLEAFGRSAAGDALALELLQDAVWGPKRSGPAAVQAVQDLLPGEDVALARHRALGILSMQGMERDPVTAVSALEVLAKEQGRTREILARLEEAYLRCDRFPQAVAVAAELIAEGLHSEREIALLVQALDRKALPADQADRILTSMVELDPYDPAALLRAAGQLHDRGMKRESLSLKTDAYRLSPQDPQVGMGLAEALKEAGDETAYENLLFDMLDITWKGNRLAVWRDTETRLRAWIEALDARGELGRVRVLKERLATARSVDLMVVLKWDTKGTDVDLHVTEPGGAVCNYERMTTAGGGVLDTDDTDGEGPETYVIRRARKGAYAVRVNFYSGGLPSRVTVTIVRAAGTPNATEETRELTLRAQGETVLVKMVEVEGR